MWVQIPSPHSPILEIKMKEVKIIIRITKKEALYLVSNGVRYGDGGITTTTGHHHKSWYVAESKKCMALLEEYNNAKRLSQ